MLNKLKLFFSAFKLLFDFIKKLFSRSDIEVNGDGNNININSNNNIHIDNSKHISKTTTTYVYENKYYPTYIPRVSYSNVNRNDDILNFFIIFALLMLSNNMIIYPYFSIFKIVTVILLLTVIACNLHILLMSPKNHILIFQFVIIVFLSIKNLTISFRFIPKLITVVGIFNDVLYFLSLVHLVSLIAFSIIIIIAYSKDVITIYRNSSVKPYTCKISIFALTILLFFNYLPIISDFIINLLSSLIRQIQ